MQGQSIKQGKSGSAGVCVGVAGVWWRHVPQACAPLMAARSWRSIHKEPYAASVAHMAPCAGRGSRYVMSVVYAAGYV